MSQERDEATQDREIGAAAGPSPTEASRDDDRSADAVRRRLDVFRSSTADVIRRYEAEGRL